MQKLILGVDIGGTHILAAVVDLNNQQVLHETMSRADVNAGGSVEEIIEAWSTAILAATGKCDTVVQHIGIAMPGPFDYEQGIALMKNQGKFDALYGVHVRPLLTQQLQVRPEHILFQNDAPSFLYGEVLGGAAKGYGKAIGLTLGTGLGSTWFRDGSAEDANRWNIPFKDSIAEEHLSSRWFVKRFQELTGQQLPHVKAIADMHAEDPRVQQLFDEFGQNLAAFLIPFVQDEQPEVIVLGGNIAKALPLFETVLLKTLHQQSITLPVKQAVLGEEAALIGAANLWNTSHIQKL
ncbi:ROK family protein [Pontibacter rugosus]|uniref:ROK family protein n=1 Tax=Pontibacter rugosus TaxID=1745966 RepID=A0ABW3SK07_9BACT